MFIEQPAIYLRWLYPRAYWRMDRRVKAVYLTFDDGPIPEATPFILDTLKEFGVRATFFMVGDNVRKYPELYKRILAEGHQVGNHTHNHIGGLRHTVKEYSYNGVEFYSLPTTFLKFQHCSPEILPPFLIGNGGVPLQHLVRIGNQSGQTLIAYSGLLTHWLSPVHFFHSGTQELQYLPG